MLNLRKRGKGKVSKKALFLNRDAVIKIKLVLLKSPSLPDQINPSGPGLRITIAKL
jgi:hypothetical protein